MTTLTICTIVSNSVKNNINYDGISVLMNNNWPKMRYIGLNFLDKSDAVFIFGVVGSVWTGQITIGYRF